MTGIFARWPEIKHNCDTGQGSSGSAQFVKIDGKMVFVAMNVFERPGLHNISTVVTGPFLQAVRNAMKD